MDLADLHIAHGADEPSGENLEYDPAFISLELAAQPGEERQVGDTIIAAEDPDHREVIEQAMDVLARSHDIRAAVFLGYSLLRTKGFQGFGEVTRYIRWVLEEYWDTCHPQLDADDDNDPTMRVNAVKSLADLKTIVAGLRTAPMTDSRAFGRFSLRDIQMADGEIETPEGMENPPAPAQVSAAFQDTNPERLAEMQATLVQVQADVRAIGAIFDDKTPGDGPDLEPLELVLKQALNKFKAQGVGVAAGSADADEEGADEADGGEDGGDDTPRAAGAPARAGGGGASGGGAINTMQDVRNTLDRLISYYRRSEPSSPVPMLLERAKRLVGADFLTIISEMAPEGRPNVNIIGGLGDDED